MRVLLCFIDESDSGDFNGFAGVVANEAVTKKLTEELNEIVNEAAISYGIPSNAEIHAHPLFHGKEIWEGVPPRVRVALFMRTVEAITSNDVKLLLRNVNASRLAARQSSQNYPEIFPPEQVCFQHILQRLQKLALQQDTFALVIADERSDRDRHRDRFDLYRLHGTPGAYMHSKLPRLLDTVHFAPSHRSRMLQAADMMAFLYRRKLTVNETDRRSAAAMDKLWSMIRESGRIFEMGSWP